MDYIAKLQEKRRQKNRVIRLFQSGKRQSDIADKIGVSRQRIHTILRAAGLVGRTE